MNEYKLVNHWPGGCFGCSPDNDKGMHLEFWMMNDACHTHYTVPAHMSGFDGMVHGGIIALMMDEVAQWSLIGTLGKIGLTRDLSIQFLKPVHTETELVVEGKLLEQSDKNVKIGLEVLTVQGEVLSTGTSNFAMAEMSKIAEITGSDEKVLSEFVAKYPLE